MKKNINIKLTLDILVKKGDITLNRMDLDKRKEILDLAELI